MNKLENILLKGKGELKGNHVSLFPFINTKLVYLYFSVLEICTVSRLEIDGLRWVVERVFLNAFELINLSKMF